MAKKKKTPSRMETTQENKRDKIFAVRLPDEYHELIKEVAKEDRRSLTEEQKIMVEERAEKLGIKVAKFIKDYKAKGGE